jgi:gliding motility-associated-like protein
MNLLRPLALFALLLFACYASAQPGTYILNGAATQMSCNCYSLTPDVGTQSGSVWNSSKINLNNPFDFWFNVYLGCKDGDGADGIVFILQPISTSVGTTGGGMGFEGLVPSIGIALDTYQNGLYNDPPYDHISIQANGNNQHTNDLAPVQRASSTSDNIEDCNWHTLRISWDPATRRLRTWFDGVPRVEATVDLVSGIFNNDPNVYWGFSGGTGGLSNVQRFCTALNPAFTTNLAAGGACTGEQVSLMDRSESFAPIASYYWDFGDGNSSTQATPPPHSYAVPGLYNIKLAIKALDGCASDTVSQAITIGSPPHAQVAVEDTCFGSAPRMTYDPTKLYGVTYDWKLNGSSFSTEAFPRIGVLSPGSYDVQVQVNSRYNCGPSATASDAFVIKPRPDIDAQVEDGCVGDVLQFSAVPDASLAMSTWNWKFGDGQTSTQANTEHTYNQTGNYNVELWGMGSNGCPSDTVLKTIRVNKAFAFAGRDTLVLPNIQFPLNAGGNGSFLWTPGTGLSSDDISNPIVTPTVDRTYTLTVTTAEGCVATDDIFIELFKGSAVWVPSAFTPNRDGKNDLFIPRYVGIRKLHYFNVYNRWGQQVFSTTDLLRGWNGEVGGKPAPTGTFVWMLKAEDLAGKTYQLKGTTTIIR